MKLEKAKQRDKMHYNRRYGHREDGRSIFVIYENDYKRAEKIKDKKKRSADDNENNFQEN